MGKPLRVLIIEDSEDDAMLLLRELRKSGYDISHERVDTPETMSAALIKQPWDIILADYVMPHFSGLAALRLLQESNLDLPFIIVSGNIGENIAVDAMKAGAHDYIIKGNLVRLVPAIERELHDVAVRRERKQAQEALGQSDARYRRLYESMTDCFIQVAMSGEIVDVNRSYLEMLGYTKEEVHKLRYQEITPPKWYKFEQKIIETQVITRGYSDVYEKEYIRKDGTVIPVELRTYLLRDTDGKPSDMWSIVRDITQRKRLEEEKIQILAREHAALAEAQAARKLDQLKSMFIASTSHELRTPLNAIIGFSSILLQGSSGELNPEQKKQLDIVHSAGKHLLSLISDVIDVSKIEAGKIDLKVSVVDLRAVVDEAVSTLGASIKEKGLELNVEIEKLTLKTDKRRLLQCILNLISNAVKYTEKGSIKIAAKTTGNRVDISVIDTGIGIKNEDIPKLFGSFVRLHTPLTENTPGTGLGLYIVNKLAKDYLGGDVEVESEYGTGSKFTLRLPIELVRAATFSTESTQKCE